MVTLSKERNGLTQKVGIEVTRFPINGRGHWILRLDLWRRSYAVTIISGK